MSIEEYIYHPPYHWVATTVSAIVILLLYAIVLYHQVKSRKEDHHLVTGDLSVTYKEHNFYEVDVQNLGYIIIRRHGDGTIINIYSEWNNKDNPNLIHVHYFPDDKFLEDTE
jgi:hypothetical protein